MTFTFKTIYFTFWKTAATIQKILYSQKKFFQFNVNTDY